MMVFVAAVRFSRQDSVGTFGDKFRREREKKKISLDDVSRVTKISSRMLQAIEQEQFDQLPGGVFNKGFIRAYARHLGLNEDEVITDYLAYMRQAQLEALTASAPPAPPTAHGKASGASNHAARKSPAPTEVEELPDLQLPRAEHVRPPRKEYLREPESGIPWSLVTVATVVVVLAIVLWIRHSHRSRIEAIAAAPPNPAPTVQNQQPVAPTPLPPAATQPLAKPTATFSHPISPTTQASTQPSTTQHPSTAPKPPATTTPKSAAPPSSAPAVQQPAKPAAAAYTLVIRANATSWISVAADGETISQETLISPAEATFHANRNMVVRVGNAAGVSFVWNGQEIPPQGSDAEVRTFSFDAQGMHASFAPQSAPNL